MTLNEMIYHRKSSTVNSQLWYFTREGDNVHAYYSRQGSRLDAGIAPAHLYAANEETFGFFKAENVPAVPGHNYIGSVTL